ncbi:MAG: winged helix-turn-helix domain-containing protein [Acidobacteriia bacterium]|nr:winged helix-turn-helix domain-containing protein [Terriglobia bacterium]
MPRHDQPHLSYRFNHVVVERDLFRVFKGAQLMSLEPRAFDLLIYLIEHRDRVVEKQELFDQIWKESFVTDDALAQEIKNIRHAIGDAAGTPRYISTVRKRGYRFIADVIIEERRAAVSVASVPSIAVLPFANLSAAPENEYFCDGLAEELLNTLTRVRDLRVVARTSAFSLRNQKLDVHEIGRRLNAATILEGSVQRRGNRVRILTQLISAADGYHLWSEQFDREMDDIFAIQDEIAAAIIDRLKVKLLPSEKSTVVKRYTGSVDAYHLYLRGRHFWNRRFSPGAPEKALEYFQQAIGVDPRYGLAYSGLADYYNLQGIFQFRASHETFPTAKAAAEKALEIDNTIAEAHTSLAYTKMLYSWDWPGAECEFKKALELNPGYPTSHLWYAQYLCAMARFDEAVAEARRAEDLDPLSLSINANVGLVLYWAREYKQAVEQLEKTLELDPDFGLAYVYLAFVLIQQGRYDQAIAAIQKSMEHTGYMPLAISKLGYAYSLRGDKAEAQKVLKEAEAHFEKLGLPSTVLAEIHGGLGDREKFFECLNRAYEERSPLLPWLKIYPEYDTMRSDPRYDELLRRLGLAP